MRGGEVRAWLASLELADAYGDAFVRLGYDDMVVVPRLDDKDMEIIGVKPGHAKKILAHAGELLQQPAKTMKKSRKHPEEAAHETPEKTAAKPASRASTATATKPKKTMKAVPHTASPSAFRTTATFGVPTQDATASMLHKKEADTNSKGEKKPSSPTTKKPASPKKQANGSAAFRDTEVYGPAATSPTRVAPKHDSVIDTGAKMCKYNPDFACGVTSCYRTCVHCKKGYCTNCLWGEGGKMTLSKCSSCGKNPRTLSNTQRPGWQ
eukprot:TRINITY_DN3385_c0_g1_i1.p1 TRINITY_DN3385_c0_g1~~TRINITY_DN3385_c0_g1_i1.p1  ORF type:complete len:308 (+),score=53.31 TRINITY_DN3385_c0_g1_i1:128-925(+)